MNDKFRYRVITRCRAIVEEQWTITSELPLTRDELEEVMSSGTETPDGVTMDCTDEQVEDEQDREVLDTYEL